MTRQFRVGDKIFFNNITCGEVDDFFEGDIPSNLIIHGQTKVHPDYYTEGAEIKWLNEDKTVACIAVPTKHYVSGNRNVLQLGWDVRHLKLFKKGNGITIKRIVDGKNRGNNDKL